MGKDLVPEEKIKELATKYLGVELVDLLTAPTPPEWVRRRPIRGGGVAEYIPGGFFTQRLNEVFGFLWSYEITESFERNGQLVGKGRLTVKIPGRTITREHPDGIKEIIRFEGLEVVKEQFGGSDIKVYAADAFDKKGTKLHGKGEPIDIGDDYKSMATDARKKCGIELGMFQDIYGPREAEEEEREGRVRGSQLGVLWMRGKQAGMDEAETREWAEEVLGQSLEESDEGDVLRLIPELVEMAKAKG